MKDNRSIVGGKMWKPFSWACSNGFAYVSVMRYQSSYFANESVNWQLNCHPYVMDSRTKLCMNYSSGSMDIYSVRKYVGVGL